MLYSCNASETNQEQFDLVKKDCHGEEAYQIDVSREFFGDDECPDTDDAKMTLWLVYSCDGGGTDQTKSNKLVTDPTSDPCDGSDVTTTTTLTPPPPTTTVTDPDTGTGTGACAGDEGTKEQVDVRGCGGWVNLDCNGGCLNIHKVLKHSLPLNQSNFSAYVGASVLRNFPVPCFVAFV